MTHATAPDLPTVEVAEEDRPDCGYCGSPGAVLVEVAAESNHFVSRCPAHLEIEAEEDEEHLSRNGKPAFSLTLEQRNAIFAGDHTAIKMKPGEIKPEVEAGQKVVLASSRGGKQFIARTEAERRATIEEGVDLLIEIPSEPTVWIVFREPKLKEGRWQLEFDAFDIREQVRTLAAAPTGNRSAGLKTRQKKRVVKKGEYKAPKLSDDSARGYGGGGKSTVDEREGVDDASLKRYAQIADEEAIKQRAKHRQMQKSFQRGQRAAEARRRYLASGANPVSIADTAAPVETSAEAV